MQHFQGKCPPERPPPPSFNSGLSIENLSLGQAEFESDLSSRNQFRDRRSVSPSRIAEQRPYNVRRSTSPLPSVLNSRSHEPLPLSRSGSRTSINQNYSHRLSRESSPLLARSASPMRTSQYSLYVNYNYLTIAVHY